MRDVLVIAHQYLPSDPRVRKQLDALAEHGLGGDVICLRADGQSKRERYRSFDLHRMPVGRHRGAGLGTYLLEYLAFFVLAGWRAAMLQVRHRHPVVITHTLPDPLVFAALVPRLNGARIVMDMHEFTPELFETRYSMESRHPFIRSMRMLERVSCAFADVVITVHHPGVDILAGRGVDRSKIAVVMNTAPMESSRAAAPSREPVSRAPFRLVYHGTLVNQYDMHTALDALELLEDDERPVALRIVGAGPGLAEMEARAGSPRLIGRVELMAPVPLDRIPELLRECDAGVVPMHDVAYSHVALPMKALECVAEGLPVITNPTGVLRHYFGDDSLWYVPFADARALADTIRRVRDDAELRAARIARAREAIAPFSWEEQSRVMAGIARGGRAH